MIFRTFFLCVEIREVVIKISENLKMLDVGVIKI